METSHTVTELHEMSGISRTALYGAIASGKLKAFTLNGSRNGKRVWDSEWRRFAAEELGLSDAGPVAPTVATLSAEAGAAPKVDYTLDEAAELTGVPWRELRAEVKARRLRTRFRAGEERVDAEELDGWLAWSGGAR